MNLFFLVFKNKIGHLDDFTFRNSSYDLLLLFSSFTISNDVY